MEVRDLTKTYGELTVLRDFSAVFPEGKITAVMGPSGCGKTTLLRLLMGLEKPDGGTILGVPEKISAVFQEDRLCRDFSAVANVRMVTGKRVPETEITAHLTALGLGESLRRPVSELSGGMKRRVAMARAVLYGGSLLLLDEPFKGLDGENRRIAEDYIRSHTAGKTVIFITHDEQEAERLADCLIRMKNAEKKM